MCRQRKAQNPKFENEQSVVVRDYRGKDKWIAGTIAANTGPVSYCVQVDPTTQWRRHADQIIELNITPVAITKNSIPEIPVSDNANLSSELTNNQSSQPKESAGIESAIGPDKTPTVNKESCCPTRVRKQNKESCCPT